MKSAIALHQSTLKFTELLQKNAKKSEYLS